MHHGSGPQNVPLTSMGSSGMKKVPKKLEEIPPASQEMAQMRKQCLDYHYKEMEALKEVFKEYLIELFFLQHLQGNMMDFLAFKKKHYAPLQAYLRQNDLDIEEEEEEEEEEEGKSEVINDEHQSLTGSLVVGPGSATEADPFKRQQVMPPTEQSKRPRLEVGHPGVVFQHPGVNAGVPLQQLMPTVQGGMPPTPQATQLTGQKQSQQQYDPSTGPPVQNAASLHTPLYQFQMSWLNCCACYGPLQLKGLVKMKPSPICVYSSYYCKVTMPERKVHVPHQC